MRGDLEERIRQPQGLEAFEIIVEGMARFPEFVPRYNVRGSKKSVHFVLGETAPCAFIANAYWLLWYFRRPGVTRGLFSCEAVMAVFPEASFTLRNAEEKREVTLKLKRASDADEALSFVARHKNAPTH
jgi:hypothetical protein